VSNPIELTTGCFVSIALAATGFRRYFQVLDGCKTAEVIGYGDDRGFWGYPSRWPMPEPIDYNNLHLPRINGSLLRIEPESVAFELQLLKIQ
jgi:hypothetical protein